MQLNLIRVGAAHVSNALPLAHCLAFLHQQIVVMRVNAQVIGVVPYHHQLAEPAFARATEYHTPARARVHCLPALFRDIFRRAYGTVFANPFWKYRLGSVVVIVCSVVLALVAFLIGFVAVASNVLVAAGHNMLGLSMAPATGKIVAEMLGEGNTHLDVAPYSLRRFWRAARPAAGPGGANSVW